MAHRDRVEEDVRIEALQEASVAMITGVLFLVVAGIASIFIPASFRSGTEFWRIYAGTIGGIGLLLTAIGSRGRSHNS